MLLEAALAKARALRVSEEVLGVGFGTGSGGERGLQTRNIGISASLSEVLRAAQSVLTAAEAQSDLFRAMDGRNIQAAIL